jgi:hypothetical protein
VLIDENVAFLVVTVCVVGGVVVVVIVIETAGSHILNRQNA